MQDAVEQARLGLCRMIATGELKPGQVLPSEIELCERFNVSRSSLREAQKMLHVAGALDLRRNASARVSQLTPKNVIDALTAIVPLLPLDSFIELFNLREILEGYCAAQAAARLSDSQIEKLEQIAMNLRKCAPGHDAQILDTEFHKLINSAANDQAIISLLKVLRQRGRDYHIYEEPERLDLKKVSDNAHLEIVQAIKNRDPERASFLARTHVHTTKTWLETYRPNPDLFSNNLEDV